MTNDETSSLVISLAPERVEASHHERGEDAEGNSAVGFK